MARRHRRTYRPPTSEGELNYAIDKDRYAALKSGEKIKLRKLVMETAQLLNKLNKIGVEENRKLIIKAYESGGILAMKAWAENVINKYTKTKENGNNKSKRKANEI